MGKLTGSCLGCGVCCTHVNVIYKRSPELDEWIEKRGLSVLQQSDQYVEIVFYQPCPHLKNGKCDLHASNKPKICRDFPANMINFWKSKGLDVNKALGDRCGFHYQDG